MSDLDRTEPTSRHAAPPPIPAAARRRATLPPPIPAAARASRATLPPPIPQQLPRATGTIPPPIPPAIPARGTATARAVQPDPSVDVDFDIDVDIPAPAPVAPAPVASPHHAQAWFAPPPNPQELFVPPTSAVDLFALPPEPVVEEPEPAWETSDLERPARSFPIVKLAIAAVLVSGLSAVITLKLIGSGELPPASVAVEQVEHAPAPVTPTPSPAVEPIAPAPAADPTAPVAAVEPSAAAAAVEPSAAAATVEPSATAAAVVPSATEPAPMPETAARQAAPAAEPVAQEPAPAQKQRTKRTRRASPDSPRTAAATPRGQGTLMVSTKPPCEIAIDGVATMLMTPQRSIKLRAGKHKVTLFNDSLNIQSTFVVTIEPGKPTKLIRDLMPR